MSQQQITDAFLRQAQAAGATHAQCQSSDSRKHELNIERGKIALLRTTFDSQLDMSLIKDQCKASQQINQTDDDSLTAAVNDMIDLAASSKPDAAYAIAEQQPPEDFAYGAKSPDLDAMYERLHEFVDMVKQRYPSIILEEGVLDFTHTHSLFRNSNDVHFDIHDGLYKFVAMFTAKKANVSSSFNYCVYYCRDLDRPLLEYDGLERLLQQTEEQVQAKPISAKFNGDVLITPECLTSFLYMYLYTFLSDFQLISGVSPLKDKLGEQVADQKLRWRCAPVSGKLAEAVPITLDGYKASDSLLVEQGVLKSFNLSLYAANKIGKPRASNNGDGFIIDTGNTSYEQCISGIERGILLSRFSGGRPNDNGDFSGVAKNSYYIENGKIQYPITETMINGNLLAMFNNISQISEQCIDFGYARLPWMVVNDIGISSK